MENKDIAKVFEQIADILEIQDDNPFRIRSYRRAAQTIDNLSFNVPRTLAEDPQRLKGIPGIGEGILAKINEIVETGQCRELEDLKTNFPESLLVLLEIQNLGPKKIHLFWRELNITDLERLETAARAGRLRDLPGMGIKSEAKLVNSIEEFRRRQGRFRLDDGIELSESLIEYLKSKLKVRRIDAAGSVRRRKETIGDLDILVSCERPAEAIEAFVEHPDVLNVIARGETKASVLLRRGLQADLRVVNDESFGAALQYFTGSKEHNVVLRDHAKRMGFKINEYGIFKVDSEQDQKEVRVGGSEEEDIYSALGLQWMPPELRENRGEIERAESGTLPQLIETEDIRGDLHVHTDASDGSNSILEMADAARNLGYEYIAITDHSKALAMARGLDEKRLMTHLKEIDRAAPENPGIAILKGIEVDILADGALDLSDEALACLDVVIASVHSRFNLTQKEMTNRVCRALDNRFVNILGHPTGRLLTRRDSFSIDLEEVIRVACQNRVSIEINAYPARLDLNDVHGRMARDMGALISINTDSHNREMFRYMRYGIFTARRAWLQAEDVINTLPLKELRRVLRKEKYR